MVQCESAKVVLFEWSHPRISSTDLKVRMTTDLGITSSRHERVKESPFALLLPPVLWEVGLQNLLFLFLLPPVLWVTGYGIFFSSSSYPLSYGWQGTESCFPLPPTPFLMGDRVRNLLFLFLLPSVLIVSILWPQADHPNCSRHGDVTYDVWSHTFTFFVTAALGCVLWSISPDHLNQAESEDHMSHVTSRCLEQFGWSACDMTSTQGILTLTFLKKNTTLQYAAIFQAPIFVSLLYFLNQELTFVHVNIVYAVTLMSYYRHVFPTLISLSSGFTKELSAIRILRWEFLENALYCFSHMFLCNYFFLSFQFLVAEHGSVQKEKLTEDYNDAYPLIFLSFLWIDNSLPFYGKKLSPERESPSQLGQL